MCRAVADLISVTRSGQIPLADNTILVIDRSAGTLCRAATALSLVDGMVHATDWPCGGSTGHDSTFSSIHHAVEHASHLLPTQGPIAVFVHHNTLHALEEQSFAEAAREGLRNFWQQPYFSEKPVSPRAQEWPHQTERSRSRAQG